MLAERIGGSLKGETPEGFFDGNCTQNRRFGQFRDGSPLPALKRGRLHMGTVTRAEARTVPHGK